MAAVGPQYDVLLRGGTVYDAANGIDGELRDVAISGGKIARVCRPGELAESAAAECVDCAGLLVMPGLVDLHAHGFKGIGFGGVDFDEMYPRPAQTSPLGRAPSYPPHIRAEAARRRRCLARCTTTVVDAGSAGCAMCALRSLAGHRAAGSAPVLRST